MTVKIRQAMQGGYIIMGTGRKADNEIVTYTSELLSALAGSGGGLQSLLDIGYKNLGNPIIVSDKTWKAIAMTTDIDIPDDVGWNEFVTVGYLSAESVTSGIRENLADRIEQSEGAFLWQSDSMQYARLLSKISMNGRTLATISVIEYNRPFTERDYLLINILCDAVSAQLQKNQFQQHTRGLLYEEFILNLLEGHLKDSKTIADRVSVLKLGIKKNIYVFVFDVGEYDSKQYSVAYMRDIIEKMISSGKAIIFNDKIVITTSFSRARDIFKTELIELSIFLKKHNIRCGISRRCTQPSELRFYYEQAIDAMQVGTQLDSERYIYPYGDYAMYHVAKALLNAAGTKTFCHPALEVLMTHDREYSTNFVESLYTYLRQFKNITNAAKALHLHRSTMVYHLKRIEEIMDISLDNYDSVQQIALSFRLLEYDKKIELRETWDDITEKEK